MLVLDCKNQTRPSVHLMENEKWSSSVSGPPETCHKDELYMHQSLLFSDSLMDLKNLRKHFYSTAEYFEKSYENKDEKLLALETIKDYAIKAFVNTLDHLGSIADKVSCFLDKEIDDMSATELRLSCIEQRLKTCQCYVDQGSLFRQSFLSLLPKHHKLYVLPVGVGFKPAGQPKSTYHRDDVDLHRFKNEAGGERAMESTLTMIRRSFSVSPQSSPGSLTFLKTLSNRVQERRDISPLRFSNSSGAKAKRRSPSPQPRPVSSNTSGGGNRSGDIDEYLKKSKRLFNALISMNKNKNKSKKYPDSR